MDGRMDRRMDTPSYRDARTHLKIEKETEKEKNDKKKERSRSRIRAGGSSNWGSRRREKSRRRTRGEAEEEKRAEEEQKGEAEEEGWHDEKEGGRETVEWRLWGKSRNEQRDHFTVNWNSMKSTHSIHRHNPLSHELRSERASERMSAAERASGYASIL